MIDRDKEIVLWGHTGSINRGCDAIVKSTADLIHNNTNWKCTLVTNRLSEDLQFGLNEFDEVIETVGFENSFVLRCVSLFWKLIMKNNDRFNQIKQAPVIKRLKNSSSVVFIVGGDTYNRVVNVNPSNLYIVNYCYDNNIPVVLWGCSIQESFKSQEFITHMKKFSYILPREQLTYNNFIEAGFDQKKLLLMSDPAFCLDSQPTVYDNFFNENDVVGINISNIAMGLGETRKQLLKSYEETIDFILNDTDMDILFIPHVYASQKKESLLFRQNKDYDTDVIDLLYFQYKNNTRVHKVEQFFNAKELKSIISQCRFIITARTHISIASYSSFVPTLVVGRAIKAFGLAESLFGTSENFVYDSSVVEHSKSLKDCFLYIYQNEKNIRHQLELSVPNLKMLNEESIKDVTLKLGNLI